MDRASTPTITSAATVPPSPGPTACAWRWGAPRVKPPRLSWTKNSRWLAARSKTNGPVGSKESAAATSMPALQRYPDIAFLPTRILSPLFHGASRKTLPRAPKVPNGRHSPMTLRRLLSNLGDAEARRRAVRTLAVLCAIGYALTIEVMAGSGAGLRRWVFALLVWGAAIYIPLRILL